MNCSPPGFSVHGISQARILEWVAISYSRGFFLTQGTQGWNPHFLHWQTDSLPLTPWNPNIPIYICRCLTGTFLIISHYGKQDGIYFKKKHQKLEIGPPSVCVLSHVQLFATSCTVACQSPLSMAILQVRILQWVAIPSSKGSSQPMDRICVS